MNIESEKREFNRVPLEFIIEVSAEDIEGSKFNDKTLLKDISGGGAKFITHQVDKYFPGQLLEVAIYLPGTIEVDARMRGKSAVVRIDTPGKSEIGEKSEDGAVAIKFETHLNFERDDVRKQ